MENENTGIKTEENIQGQNTENTGATGNGTKGSESNNETKLSPFDEFLKGDGMQAEFDRRVAKALETQRTKINATTQEQINSAVQEALKVAKMTKEEQAQHEAQKKIDELNQREQAIKKRELRANAIETLSAKQLPVELADTINYTDDDSVNASIEALEKAFQTSVQARVEQKMKGTKPLHKAEGDNNALAEQIAKAMKNGFYG